MTAEARREASIVGVLRVLYATGVACVVVNLAIGLHVYHVGLVVPFVPGAIVGVVIAVLAAFAEIWFGGRSARRRERALRRRLLQHIFTLGASFNRSTQDDSARMIGMLTDNTERVNEYRQVYYGATIAAIVIPFATLLYVAVEIDWVIGIVLMVLCPLIPVAVVGFMRLFAGSSRQSRAQRARLSNKYLDAIRNLVTIRMIGAGQRVESQLRTEGESNRKAIMKLLAGNQIVIIVLDGMFSLVMVCLTCLLVMARYRAGAIGYGEGIAVIFLMVLLLEPLLQVAGFFYIGMGGMAAERAIGRYLAQQPPKPVASTDGEHPDPHQAAIFARDLRFSYGRGEVLRGVDLDVTPGSRCAIVGRSGSGKSTLLGLLRHDLPLQGGHLWVHGSWVQDSASGVDSAIAFVAQRTWLFTGTIRQNLVIAKADATDDELWSALEQANVADEIRRMPGQLDASVGEQGVLISGGQAQRLSLARALLSGRPILFLDEPTSQVDIVSEGLIIDAIASIPKEQTVVMVTHRRALLSIADQVIELVDGQTRPYQVSADDYDFGDEEA